MSAQAWRAWLPALALLGLGAIQMARVANTDLSRWKGAGMGMYSEFHYREREVWLRVQGERADPDATFVGAKALGPIERLAFVCVKQGDDACLQRVADAVARDGVTAPFEVGLWTWDWRDGVLFRRKIKGVNRAR